MAAPSTVLAAGTLVHRRHDGHTELLAIHRPEHDDWSFPKGKLDPGELLPWTAMRETEEETGVRVRLGAPLATHEYQVRGAPAMTKQVHYWIARPTGEHDVDTYRPNREVDRVRWVRLREVAGLLTYDRDREVLAQFRRLQRRDWHRARSLLLLRHATARARGSWDGPDGERTLTGAGERQALRVAPTLRAYGVRRVVSSDARRCVATALPYADAIGADIVLDPRLSEQAYRPKRVRRATYDLLDVRPPVAAVTHRPVLPYVTDALGLDDVHPLAPAEVLVVHHRDGDIVATERHQH